MTTVTVKVQEIENKDEVLFPEITADAKEIIQGAHIDVGILEGGMQNGATSLAFMFRHEDKAFILEMSGRNFEVLAGVYTGFQQLIQNKRAKKN